jgi:hypothetical protein
MAFHFLPTLADLGSLAAVLTVLAFLYCLGTPLVTAGLGVGNNFLIGWAIASLALTIGGAVLGFALTPILIILAAIAAVVGWRSRHEIGLARIGPILLALTPLLLIIAPKVASEVDDFAHWIPNAAYLYDLDHFLAAGLPPSASFRPAFPQNTAFIMLAASRLAGRFLEASGLIFNTLLIAPLALMLVRQWQGHDGPITFGVGALGVLGATAFNPTFVPKIALSGYADFPTGVVLAGFAIVGADLIRRITETTPPVATMRPAIEAGLLLSLLINIKQANLVLAAIGISALLILAMIEGRAPLKRFVRVAPVVVAIPAVAYIAWRFYLARGIAGGENKIMPFAQWNLEQIPEIAGNMASVLLHKGGLTGLVILAVVVGSIALCRRRLDNASRLSVIAGLLFLGNTAFLTFIYIAHFDAHAGPTAQSVWRYCTQLGPTLLVAAAAFGGSLWRRYRVPLPRWGAVVAMAAVVIAPLALAKKFRFDLDPPQPYIHAMARAVDQELPADARLLIVVLKDDGWQATVMRLRTWRPTRAYHVLDNDTFRPAEMLDPQHPTYAWFYCGNDRLRTSFNLDLPRDGASLVQHSGGDWRLVRTWTYPLPPDAATGHDKFRTYGCLS